MKKYLTLILALILSGCFGGVSDPARFYTLNTVPEHKVISTKKLSIAVDYPILPSYLDRPQLILINPISSDVIMEENHRWIEPFGKLFERTLINDLYAYLPKSIIKNKSLSREKMDWTVSVQVNQFTGSLNEKIKLDVIWSITSKEGKIVRQQRTQLTEQVKDSYSDFAYKQSLLVSKLAQEIALEVNKLSK